MLGWKGEETELKCDVNYKDLVGTMVGEQPYCERVKCPEPEEDTIPENAVISGCAGRYMDQTCNASCKWVRRQTRKAHLQGVW
jgi:hypothetical protein